MSCFQRGKDSLSIWRRPPIKQFISFVIMDIAPVQAYKRNAGEMVMWLTLKAKVKCMSFVAPGIQYRRMLGWSTVFRTFRSCPEHNGCSLAFAVNFHCIGTGVKESVKHDRLHLTGLGISRGESSMVLELNVAFSSCLGNHPTWIQTVTKQIYQNGQSANHFSKECFSSLHIQRKI